MKIAIVPASTQAGKATIESLLKAHSPPQIRAIYRNVSRAPNDFYGHPQFQAVQGGLDDGLDLDFADADAVFYVPPPTYDEQLDSGEHAAQTAKKVKAALRRSKKVRRLVLFSAFYDVKRPDGIGILKINQITDDILSNSAPEVVIAMPGWFHENWAEAVVTAKGDEAFFETHFTPADHKIVMVSLVDIGRVIAKTLLETGEPLPSTPQVFTLHGPREYSMLDLQVALEQVTSKKVRMEAVKAEDLLELFKSKLGPIKAQEVTDMTLAINQGGVIAKVMANPQLPVVRGKVELVDILRGLAKGEVSKVASGAF